MSRALTATSCHSLNCAKKPAEPPKGEGLEPILVTLVLIRVIYEIEYVRLTK